jgi:predicted signal transduction protein with EAL and GGDEF domain
LYAYVCQNLRAVPANIKGLRLFDPTQTVKIDAATLRQMEVLHRLGCGVMQGFLFSRPRPAGEIQGWLEGTLLARNAPWIGDGPGPADVDDEPVAEARLRAPTPTISDV